jgi:integrase
MKKVLTDLYVRRLRQAAHILEVVDIDQLDSRGVLRRGFFLRVSPKGRKSWYGRFPTTDGYSTKQIGIYPDMSLKEAREHFDIIRYDEERDNITVEDLCKRYIQEYARHPEDGYKRWQEDEREIYLDIIPSLGGKLASDVTRSDIRQMALEIKERGAVTVANWAVALLRRIYNWGIKLELLERNPASMFEPFKERGRTCYLNESQLKIFLHKLPESSMPVYAQDALMFQLQTAARIGEVLNMEWHEVDFEASIWTVPPHKSKNRHAHRVMLSRQSIQLLTRRYKDSKSRFVFPSSRDLNKPNWVESLASQIVYRREKLGVPKEFTSHALRRTVLTHAAMMQYGLELRNRISNHVMGGIDSVYNKFTYDEPAREFLQVWADKLDRIATKLKVIEAV